tara:strand:+ start:807 stop:1013 length:207 start_codon:yes stop_codon:yes gene_type:complete
MDYVEATDILDELTLIMLHVPSNSPEFTTIVKRMAKLQLFIQEYDKWADEQAAKWDYQNKYEEGNVHV